MALTWMPWILLSVAILFEVAGITSMKLSRGFAELLPVARRLRLLCLLGGGRDPGAAAGSSSRSPMPSGPASARRSTAMIGIAYFREPLTVVQARLARARGASAWSGSEPRRQDRATDRKLAAILLIIAGMDGLLGQSDGLIRLAVFAAVFLLMAVIELLRAEAAAERLQGAALAHQSRHQRRRHAGASADGHARRAGRGRRRGVRSRRRTGSGC